jgi:hypothetical protein
MTKTDTWQTRLLVRESASKRQDSNFEKKNISGQMSQIWGLTPRQTDWLTVSRNVTLTLIWLPGFVYKLSSYLAGNSLQGPTGYWYRQTVAVYCENPAGNRKPVIQPGAVRIPQINYNVNNYKEIKGLIYYGSQCCYSYIKNTAYDV